MSVALRSADVAAARLLRAAFLSARRGFVPANNLTRSESNSSSAVCCHDDCGSWLPLLGLLILVLGLDVGGMGGLPMTGAQQIAGAGCVCSRGNG